MQKMSLLKAASFWYLCRGFWKAKGIDRLPRGQLANTLENIEWFSIVFDGPAEWVWLYEGEY